MKFPKTLNKEHLLSFVSAIILFAGTTAVLAWTAPGANPPDGNAPAPINVSGNGQIKNGFLGLYGKNDGNGTNVGLAISKNDTNYGLLNNLSLGVRGKIGADLYCDSQGLNCVDILAIKTSITTINNHITNNATTTGCVTTQQTYTVNTAITGVAAGNLVSKDIAVLAPGTWTVSGSGMADRASGGQGSMALWIRVSKNGVVDNNNLFLLKKSTTMSVGGQRPSYPGSMTWEVPTTTFTITGSEKIVLSSARSVAGGSITITGPKTVCN